jgi:hypothetical protein
MLASIAKAVPGCKVNQIMSVVIYALVTADAEGEERGRERPLAGRVLEPRAISADRA